MSSIRCCRFAMGFCRPRNSAMYGFSTSKKVTFQPNRLNSNTFFRANAWCLHDVCELVRRRAKFVHNGLPGKFNFPAARAWPEKLFATIFLQLFLREYYEQLERKIWIKHDVSASFL